MMNETCNAYAPQEAPAILSVTEENAKMIELANARVEGILHKLRGDVNNLQLEVIDAGIRANYAESHPWRNLWAWVKRKLGGE